MATGLLARQSRKFFSSAPLSRLPDDERAVVVALRCALRLFCDDVRLEVGNKLSFMGVFQNIMVQQMPVSLIKFAVVNHWRGEGTHPHAWCRLPRGVQHDAGDGAHASGVLRNRGRGDKGQHGGGGHSCRT